MSLAMAVAGGALAGAGTGLMESRREKWYQKRMEKQHEFRMTEIDQNFQNQQKLQGQREHAAYEESRARRLDAEHLAGINFDNAVALKGIPQAENPPTEGEIELQKINLDNARLRGKISEARAKI